MPFFAVLGVADGRNPGEVRDLDTVVALRMAVGGLAEQVIQNRSVHVRWASFRLGPLWRVEPSTPGR